MKEKAIIMGCKPERTDYNALRAYYMYARTPQRTKIMVCILLASLLLLALSGTAYGPPFFKFIGLAGIMAIAGMYSWISIDARKLEKSAHDIVNKWQEISFMEEGFSVKWKGLSRTEEWSWSEIDYVYEDDSYFFLFIEQHTAIVASKLELKAQRKEHKIKEIHNLIEKHGKLISEVRDFKYEKF